MYQHGRRTKSQKSKGSLLAALAIVGVVVLIVAYIVHKDIAGSTAPKTNVPIVTEVGAEDDEEKLKINENLFSFDLPADWKLSSSRKDGRQHFYIWNSTKKGAADRRLTLYVDIMPANHKLVKLQPITPNGAKLILGNLSDDCVNFAGSADRQGNAEFEAKWENVSFMCDPIKANQTIGTGTVEGGIKTTVGNHSYFFFYEDHNIRPDSQILADVLRSFVAR